LLLLSLDTGKVSRMGTKQTAPVRPVVARLDQSHDRSKFDCGVDSLNRYLLTQATQDLRRGLAVPYVVLLPPSNAVAAYFTLSAVSIDLVDLPDKLRSKLPSGAVIGASLLGRLAVDRTHQGTGLGEYMLGAAVDLSFDQSPLACVLMIVDAINDRAAEFYKHFDFKAFPEAPHRLFLVRESLAKYL
jgi:GNAT superfamily N-acetyltransferase